MINTSINIIFGHDHFIQRQINSNKTHLAIPNCYYQFLQDMEKHIPAHNQSASTFLNCGQK